EGIFGGFRHARVADFPSGLRRRDTKQPCILLADTGQLLASWPASPIPRNASDLAQPGSGETVMRQIGRRAFIHGLAYGLGGALLASSRLALAAGSIAVDENSVLIVVDVQNCFLPGGSLAVKDGEQVVPVINRIAQKFAHVVLTQDWHTPG